MMMTSLIVLECGVVGAKSRSVKKTTVSVLSEGRNALLNVYAEIVLIRKRCQVILGKKRK